MALFPSTAIPSAAGGYDINYSCRFQEANKSYLHQTFSSAGNRKTWTLSFWFKRTGLTYSAHQYIFSADNNGEVFIRGTGDDMGFQHIGASSQWIGPSPRKFRDISAWYHYVLAVDTSQAAADDRAKMYINGERITTAELNSGAWGTGSMPALNAENDVNNNVVHSIGWKTINNQTSFDGYIAEHIFVDGTQYGPEAFGEVDETYGHWKAKEFEGTFGGNGWHLDFANAAALGNDISGNNHDFALSNISSHDQSTDTPTNNFATLNPIWRYGSDSNLQGTPSEGDLKTTISGQGGFCHPNTIPVSSGKWYWEAQVQNVGNNAGRIGICTTTCLTRGNTGAAKVDTVVLDYAGVLKIGTGATDHSSHSGSFATGTKYIVSVMLNLDDNEIEIRQNNVSAGGAESIPAGEYEVFADFMSSGGSFVQWYNFGQDGTFAGEKTAQGNSDSEGIGNFYYAVPSGFKALCSKNLPNPGVDKASEHFKPVLYTGNGGTQNISVGFQPNFVWLKCRTTAHNNELLDTVRGATKRLRSDQTGAESTQATGLTAFNSTGFALGGLAEYNQSSQSYVSWNWKGGTDASGTTSGSGTGKSYTASYNAAAGFSIVAYTGNGTAGHTIPHHLSAKPQLIFVKRRPAANDSWAVYNEPSGATKYMNLDNNSAQQTGIYHWNNTEPTSSVFTLYTNGGSNENDKTYIAYVWHSVEGYSKVGSYKGNANNNGAFVYTGFKPAFLLIKNIDAAENWRIFDIKRDPYNQMTKHLFASIHNVESVETGLDFLSNGFKFRHSDAHQNGNNSYLFYAIAEEPFKYTTAR